MNKLKRLALRVGAGVAACAATTVLAIPGTVDMQFDSQAEGLMKFDGAGHITFSADPNFSINHTLGGGGSLNLLGSLEGTLGVDAAGNVTGTATLTIHGPGANDLTGTVTWNNLSLSPTHGGSIGLTTSGASLTGITYPGVSPNDLTRLRDDLIGLINLQFSALGNYDGTSSPPTLAQLATGGSEYDVTFNGRITGVNRTTVPDGGLTLALLGGVILGVEGLRRKLAA
jgi:hypothetical protein